MKMLMLILRIIGIVVAVVFFGFFVIPMTHGIINPGNIAGTFLCLWLLCVLIPPVHGAIILRGRIDAAKSYLDDSPNANAVLSGGQGSDEIMSEAQCMYNVLTESKIDSSRLYMEDKSTNTTENIRNSMKIIEDNNLNTDITIVTDGFHQLRARIICSQLGIKGNVGAVSSDTRLLYVPTYAVREWFALPFQLLFR